MFIFCANASGSKISVTLNHQVLRDKKKEPAVSWPANFPRLPRQFKYILNNFELSKLERGWKKNNKPTRNSRVDQKSAEIKLAPFSVGKLHFLQAHSTG